MQLTVSRWALLSLSAALAGCTDETPAPAPAPSCLQHRDADAELRLFVVGHKHQVSDGESYASYAASYRRHMDGIAPCLSDALPNLVAFPEGTGLVALTIGSRGAEARAEASSTDAFVTVVQSYLPQAGYYADAFPGISLQRQVFLALSDVVWRATLDTFGGIARDWGLWVITNTDVGRVEHSDDPALVAQLGDPDRDPSEGVYVATEPGVYNTTLLFDPSGALVDREDKVFLTDPEEELLDLANGDFAEAGLLETPFARIAAPISRDAFYPAYMQRMEDLGADLVVQPEAFSGWAIEQLPGDWLPDVFLTSGWHHQQKYGAFRYSVAPQLTGHFFEMVFDGQLHVADKARPGAPEHGYVGQEPIAGFSAVGPWVSGEPAGDLEARRAALRATGQALAPGSASAIENGYIDSRIAADLRLTRQAIEVSADTSRSTSAAPAPSSSPQRAPSLASDARGRLILAWEEDGAIRLSSSVDGGASWSAPQTLGSAARRPSVCVHADGRAAVSWQQGTPGSERLHAAATEAIGEPLAAPIEVDGGGGPQWEPSCGFFDDRLVLAWTDLRSGVPMLRSASRAWAMATFDASVAVDPPAMPLRMNGAQLQPSISPEGGHLVWCDYRERSWDIYYSRFDGSAFAPGLRIDGVAGERERLHADPRVVARGARVLVAWTDLHDRRAHSDIGYALSDDGGATFSAHAAVPGGAEELGGVSAGGAALSRFRPAIAADEGGEMLVFQDVTPAKGALMVAAIGAPPERLDDTGEAAVSLTRPAAARALGATVAAWEDDRDGLLQIYLSRSP
jgi:hypothetical protein